MVSEPEVEFVSLDEAMERALAHHQAGQLTQAEDIYRKVLNAEPGHADAQHFLGVIAHQCGKHAAAVELIDQALAINPLHPLYLNNKGQALQAQGRLQDALACYETALRLNPALAVASSNLGSLLAQRGKYREAIGYYQKAVALEPQNADTFNDLGSIFYQLQESENALTCYRNALSLNPGLAAAHNNLGNVFAARGEHKKAVVSYENALALEPNHADSHNNLGNVLAEQGKYEGAITHYQKALALEPNFAEAYNNLGNVHKSQGRLGKAVDCYQRAATLNPEYAEPHSNLGNVLRELGRMEEAMACCERALALQQNHSKAHNNLGNIFKEQGQIEKAIASFRNALAIEPSWAAACSNLLLTLNYVPDLGVDEIYAEHLEFARRFEEPLLDRRQSHSNPKEPDRRLTIGYLSPDLRSHPVSRFLRPVLANHENCGFNVVCYNAFAESDAMTQALKGYANEWRDICGMSDDDVAQRIRSDSIDILVDLAGHSAHNRLLVFARKPAPVQVAWLGYLNTTGLSAMDYRLTDRYAEPAGYGCYYSEELMFLPDSAWCYSQQCDHVKVDMLPALGRGYVTFGSFNTFAKVGPGVLAIWARLLNKIPQSRLLMVAPPGLARSTVINRFSAGGVGAERIEFVERVSYDRYLELHNQVDIALDPFPYNGGTTTCDALWMGVPVLSLAGDRFVSRLGVSLLRAAGLQEWIAWDEEQYVEIGKKWAHDLARLKRLREGLRGQLRTSPLMDAKRFTLNLEKAYRQMWRQYCRTGNV